MKKKSKFISISTISFMVAFQLYSHIKKGLHLIWLVIIPFVLLHTASGQGFVNLNFEQASIASAPSGYTPSDAFDPISATSALPHWVVSEDGTICTAVWGAPVALDETSVALVSAGYSPIQGNYSVELSAYADASSPYFRNSSISQTGFIPIGTQSIQFLMVNPFPTSGIQANPVVTLNGTPINLSQISASGGVIAMVGDVSAFAGTTANLTFLCAATQGGGFPANENYFSLDNIQFSAVPVPEPSEFALAALGTLLLGFRRSIELDTPTIAREVPTNL